RATEKASRSRATGEDAAIAVGTQGGFRGRSPGTDLHGQGRLRSPRGARSLGPDGRGVKRPSPTSEVPLHSPVRGDPGPSDRGLAAGGHAVLPAAEVRWS